MVTDNSAGWAPEGSGAHGNGYLLASDGVLLPSPVLPLGRCLGNAGLQGRGQELRRAERLAP